MARMNLHPDLDRVANRIVFVYGPPACGKTHFATTLYDTLKDKGFNTQLEGNLSQFLELDRNEKSVFISENFPMQFAPIRDEGGHMLNPSREWEILKSAHHMYINATDEDAHFLMSVHCENSQLTQKRKQEIIDEFHKNVVDRLLIKELRFKWGEYCGVPILSPLGEGRFGRAINHPTGGITEKLFEEQVKFHVERISSSIFLYGEGRITGEKYLKPSCKER